jgi:hypothetical protein
VITLIEADYRAYQAGVAAGLPGYYAELTPLMDAMARVELATLAPWSGLTAAYGWPPAKISDTPPFIVGVPGHADITAAPVFTETSGGFPGAEQGQEIPIDRLIVGGSGADVVGAMQRAAALWLPLNFAYAHNGTLDGACHGALITGATWQKLPLGGTDWIVLAVHVLVTSYYALPVG